MSFLLICVAWPKDTLLLGIGTIVGRLFLEKAYLKDNKHHNTELVELVFDELDFSNPWYRLFYYFILRAGSQMAMQPPQCDKKTVLATLEFF